MLHVARGRAHPRPRSVAAGNGNGITVLGDVHPSCPSCTRRARERTSEGEGNQGNAARLAYLPSSIVRLFIYCIHYDSPKPYDLRPSCLPLPPSSTLAPSKFRVTPWPPPALSSPALSPSRSSPSLLMDSSRTSSTSLGLGLNDDDYDAYPAHTRLPNDQILEFYAELTLHGAYHLLPYEEAWKARRPFLESRGYELRPRYSDDWWPSWVGTNINPFFCEDSIDSCVRTTFLVLFLFPGVALVAALLCSASASGQCYSIGAEGLRSTQQHANACSAYDIPRRLTLNARALTLSLFTVRNKAQNTRRYTPLRYPSFRIRPVARPNVPPQPKRGRNAPLLSRALRCGKHRFSAVPPLGTHATTCATAYHHSRPLSCLYPTQRRSMWWIVHADLLLTVATYYGRHAVGGRRTHTRSHQGNPKLDPRIQHCLHVFLRGQKRGPTKPLRPSYRRLRLSH